jgi:hypothetical protein
MAPNETFRVGYLYADAPGRGGGALLDTVMGSSVVWEDEGRKTPSYPI